MSSIVNTIQRRCGNFHDPAPTQRCYLQCWPFDGLFCSHCEDVSVEWGIFKTAIWDAFFGWWWEGAVLVKEEYVVENAEVAPAAKAAQ